MCTRVDVGIPARVPGYVFLITGDMAPSPRPFALFVPGYAFHERHIGQTICAGMQMKLYPGTPDARVPGVPECKWNENVKWATCIYEAMRIGAGWGYSWVLFRRSTETRLYQDCRWT
eukprot:2135472-Rhodomonas_salina.3